MAEFGLEKQASRRIAYLEKDDDDAESNGYTSDATVDSPSMDISFGLSDLPAAEEVPSSPSLSKHHAGIDGNANEPDSVTSGKQADTAIIASGRSNDDYGAVLAVDDAQKTDSIVPAAAATIRSDVVIGGDEGPDKMNQSMVSVGGTEDTCGHALPGAFNVYSKLADVRRGKDLINDENACPQKPTNVHDRSGHEEHSGIGKRHQVDRSVGPSEPGARHEGANSAQSRQILRKTAVASAVSDAITETSDPGARHETANSAQSRQILRKSSVASAVSDARTETTSLQDRDKKMPAIPIGVDVSTASSKRHTIASDASIDRRRLSSASQASSRTPPPGHRAAAFNDNDVSESSNLAIFLEDLSESISEMALSPRRSMMGQLSPRANTRETIMHRRVKQKQRRNTPATEPGVTTSNVLDDEVVSSQGSSQHSDDDVEDLYLPTLHSPVLPVDESMNDEANAETDGVAADVSETNPDLTDLEHGMSRWSTALTATLVTDVGLKDDERARVIEETKQALTASAVAAEVIDLDAIVGHSKKRQRLRWAVFVCLALVLAMVAVIVSVKLRRTTDESTLMPSPPPTASPAPSPFVNGNSAFQSRDELIQAVDLYMLALFEGSAENSSVAQRYGYPMRNWDVSGVQDFHRVFDFSQRGDLYIQNPAFLNFDEDLEGWDGNMKFQGRGLSKWIVDGVTDFSFMFAENINLKENLGNWNTTAAKKMMGMFLAASFHDGIANWDVSNVESTDSMFEYSPQNTTVDLNRWDVRNVKSMNAMFLGSKFNGKIDKWNVRNVESMVATFSESSFNQNVSGWKTESLKMMKGVFSLSAYRGNLTSWNTSRVVDFSFAFTDSQFRGDISGWDVSNGQQFPAAFRGTDSFDGDLSKWDMGAAVDCTGMFADSTGFTGKGIGRWNVSNLAIAKEMFAGADQFQEDVSMWNVAQLQDATRMFTAATSFNHSLCAWSDDLRKSIKVEDMFLGTGCIDQTALVLSKKTTTNTTTSLCRTCPELR